MKFPIKDFFSKYGKRWKNFHDVSSSLNLKSGREGEVISGGGDVKTPRFASEGTHIHNLFLPLMVNSIVVEERNKV